MYLMCPGESSQSRSFGKLLISLSLTLTLLLDSRRKHSPIIATAFLPSHITPTSLSLHQLYHNKMHFFNNAGASPSPPDVLSTITSHLELEMTEGGYGAARIVQENGRLEGVYKAVAGLINASSPMEVALVESATVAWTRAFYSMADFILDEGLKEAEQVMRGSISDDLSANMQGASSGKSSFRNSLPLQRVILVSEAEYAANVVAIAKFCSDQNRRHSSTVHFKICVIPSKIFHVKDRKEMSTGAVDVKKFGKILDGEMPALSLQEVGLIEDRRNYDFSDEHMLLNPEDIAMVCVTHIPTNSGIINPVNELGRMLKEYNDRESNKRTTSILPRIFYLVDACQSVGQVTVDVQEMHADAISATGRKYLRGPRGTGFLYMRETVANNLRPSEVDHAAAPIKSLKRQAHQNMSVVETRGLGTGAVMMGIEYRTCARRFEYWESNISTKLGLGAAIDHLEEIGGISYIEQRIKYLASRLRNRLCTLGDDRDHHLNKNINVYHDHSPSLPLCGIVCFSIDGVHSQTIQKFMGAGAPLNDPSSEEERFELSVVPLASTPIDSSNTGVHELVRVSLSYFNTEEEIECFIAKLQNIIDDESKHVNAGVKKWTT